VPILRTDIGCAGGHLRQTPQRQHHGCLSHRAYAPRLCGQALRNSGHLTLAAAWCYRQILLCF
ncbi:unnamed protein product, partial [Bubo scandiacus]